MNTISYRLLLRFVTIAFLLSTPAIVKGQCWPALIPSATCGVLGGDITPVSGSNSFCNGDSVAVLLTAGLAVDSICIDWGDGIFQILPGSAVGTVVYHYYNITPADTCPDPPPLVTQITVTFVRNCPGSYSMSKSIEVITIQFLPNTDFFLTPDSFLCVNENLCSVVDGLTAPYTCTNAVNVGGDTAFYSWDMGNGDIILDTAINVNTYNCPNYLYTDTGNYTITLTCENKCGMTSNIVPITVVTSEIDVGINLLDTCSPVVFTPSISSTNINTFFWTLNPALPGNIISAPTNDTTVISITNSGTFTLTLNTTGGCCAFPQPNICGWDTMITVYPGPELTHIPIPDTCVLAPLNLDLSNYYSGFIVNDSMQWIVYENGTQVINTVSFTPPVVNIDSGVYVVEVTFANNCGIEVQADTFNVFNPFTVTVPPDDTICAGIGTYYLSATPEGGTWTWNGNPLADSTFVISSTADTIVEFIYSIGFGLCAASDSFTVYFPGSDVSGGPDRVLCGNAGTITLPTGSHPNGVWSGSPAISGNIYDPAAAVNNPDIILIP